MDTGSKAVAGVLAGVVAVVLVILAVRASHPAPALTIVKQPRQPAPIIVPPAPPPLIIVPEPKKPRCPNCPRDGKPCPKCPRAEPEQSVDLFILIIGRRPWLRPWLWRRPHRCGDSSPPSCWCGPTCGCVGCACPVGA
jgi:hypothetical protein